MTGKRVQLDLGQIAMPVGEDRSGGQAGGVASGSDVARLQAILRRPAVQDRPHSGQSATDLWSVMAQAAGTRELQLPAEVLATTAAAADGQGDFMQQDPAQIGAELESLWVCNGAHGLREVRLNLRKEILPHTSVRLFEASGRLQVDMRVADESTRRWLAGTLPQLAASLGERLARPLSLRVSGLPPARPENSVVEWPQDVAGAGPQAALLPDSGSHAHVIHATRGAHANGGAHTEADAVDGQEYGG